MFWLLYSPFLINNEPYKWYFKISWSFQTNLTKLPFLQHSLPKSLFHAQKLQNLSSEWIIDLVCDHTVSDISTLLFKGSLKYLWSFLYENQNTDAIKITRKPCISFSAKIQLPSTPYSVYLFLWIPSLPCWSSKIIACFRRKGTPKIIFFYPYVLIWRWHFGMTFKVYP